MKIALRSLFRRPGFTAVAIITLAVGTGGNTAIFSTVNAVLLRDLSYREPEQLFAIGTEMVDGRSTTGGLSPAALTRVRAATDLTQNATGTFQFEGVLLDRESNPVRATAYGVMARFFDVFNVPMTLRQGIQRRGARHGRASAGRFGPSRLAELLRRRRGGHRSCCSLRR